MLSQPSKFVVSIHAVLNWFFQVTLYLLVIINFGFLHQNWLLLLVHLRTRLSLPQVITRRLARAYVARTAALPEGAVAAVVGRWAARLSALVVLGNCAVYCSAGLGRPPPPRAGASGVAAGAPPLPLCTPEGESAYKLLVA